MNRPSMYPETSATQARRLLLGQISSRQTLTFVRCLLRWPRHDMQRILHGIIRPLTALWVSSSSLDSDARATASLWYDFASVLFPNLISSYCMHSISGRRKTRSSLISERIRHCSRKTSFTLLFLLLIFSSRLPRRNPRRSWTRHLSWTCSWLCAWTVIYFHGGTQGAPVTALTPCYPHVMPS